MPQPRRPRKNSGKKVAFTGPDRRMEKELKVIVDEGAGF